MERAGRYKYISGDQKKAMNLPARNCTSCQRLFAPERRGDNLCQVCRDSGNLSLGKKADREGELWRKRKAYLNLRRKHLDKNPYCVHCLRLGILNSTNVVVDHIIPHKGNIKLLMDKNNLQTLCIPEHNRKTGIENS